MRHLILLACLLCLSGGSAHLFAQPFTVHGIVLDAEEAPVELANLTLHRAADSSLLKGVLSEADGSFRFELREGGRYFLQAYLVGYEPFGGPVFDFEAEAGYDAGVLQLRAMAIDLEGVTVTASRPFIERRLDKLVVNVENSVVDAGATALEVLERSPTVLVNSDGSISLKGRQGVIVLIDDKPVQLSGEGLANLLRSTPSSSIDQIEIIANPSARYDAEGSAGMINLKMKKDQRLGTNGAVQGSYGQGKYEKISAGLDLNHRTRRWNFFSNYNYGKRRFFNNLVLFRRFREEAEVQTIFDQDNFLLLDYQTHTVRAGLDFFPSEKTTVGILLNGVHNRMRPKADNESFILDPSEAVIGRFTTTNRSQDQWNNYSINLNLKQRFPSTGGELSADLDFADYWNNTDQLFNTDYFDPAGQLTEQGYLRGDIDGSLELYAAKADLTQPLGNAGKLDAGLKSSYVKADNDLRYFILENEVEVLDTRQSNHFIYEEQINAGYLNWSKEWEKWNLQLGLRGEQTIADGLQVTTDSAFHRNYFQWFPSAFVNYTPSEKHSWGISVSRRIHRPDYEQLNPFRAFVDPTTFREGNPFLQPQLTYSVEGSHTFRQRWTTTLTYSLTGDNITYVLLQNDEEKYTVVTHINIDRYEYYGLGFSSSFTPAPWWNTFVNLSIFHQRFKGDVSGYGLDQSGPAFHLDWNNSFDLPGNWKAELGGFYMHRSVFGVSVIEPQWSLNVGVQRSFFDQRLNLRLNARDLFWRAYPRGSTQFGNIDETFISYRDSRVVTLAMTWSFGKKTVQQARRRQTGAEDEKRRAGNG